MRGDVDRLVEYLLSKLGALSWVTFWCMYAANTRVWDVKTGDPKFKVTLEIH